MRVLVACEFSATVRDAFRRLGHNAISCDILPTEGDPRWHIRDDVRNVINGWPKWDLLIAFPPCTDLAAIGASKWRDKQQDGRQDDAIHFALSLYYSRIPKVAIENPVGILSTVWRKPDQIINPFQFGHPWSKKTCLWLKDLPLLQPTDIVHPIGKWVAGQAHKDRHGVRRYRRVTELRYIGQRTASDRARTFQGIARAMARQWGGDIRNEKRQRYYGPAISALP